MKHILNDLTEQEKNAIREQHTGGMKVSNYRFKELLENKLGNISCSLLYLSVIGKICFVLLLSLTIFLGLYLPTFVRYM